MAAALDVPVDEITSRCDPGALTNKERHAYAEYYRLLRSTSRADRMHTCVHTLKQATAELRIALSRGKDVEKLLQTIETTVEALNDLLAYGARPLAKKWSDGDDLKLSPGRLRVDWDKLKRVP